VGGARWDPRQIGILTVDGNAMSVAQEEPEAPLFKTVLCGLYLRSPDLQGKVICMGESLYETDTSGF